MKKIFLLSLLVFGFFIFLSGVGSAVECNADLSNIGAGCTVSSSLNLNGTYNLKLNGTINGNLILLNFNNGVFDCNGTTITGNWSRVTDLDYRGIVTNSQKSNVTIKNCNLAGFSTAFKANANNINITFDNVSTNNVKNSIWITYSNRSAIVNSKFNNNSNFHNYIEKSHFINISNNIYTNTTANFAVTLVTSASDVSIFNNSFDNSAVISTGYNNVRISNNQLKGSQNSYLLSFETGNNNTIDNNNISSLSSAFVLFLFQGLNNSNVYNNYFYNITGGSGFVIDFGLLRSNNNRIFNNTCLLVDGCIVVAKSNGTLIYNNTISYAVNNNDYYDSGIVLELNNTNFEVFGNNLTNIGGRGIGINWGDNGRIYNNFIDMLPVNQYLNYPVIQLGEPPCAIAILQYYKTYYVNSGYVSYNISIYNNTISNNAQCYLRNQGGINVTHDLTSFWFKSFQFPTYLLERDDFYLNLAFENITLKNSSSLFLTDSLKQGYDGIYQSLFKLHQSWEYYQNINLTASQELRLYNKTNALLHNTTSICNGSSSSTNSNDNNINITLSPNNYCYALDNYNLTEEVTRLNNPLSISGTLLSKTINSSLTQGVNVTVIVSTDRCDTNAVYNGLVTTYSSCGSGKSTFNLLNIPSGQSTLTLTPIQQSGGGGNNNNNNNNNSNYPNLFNNSNNPTLETTYSKEICKDVKSFLTEKSNKGLPFNKIPISDIDLFTKSQADKYKLPENIIKNFIYLYESKCNEDYPISSWLWLKKNWMYLLIAVPVIFLIANGLKGKRRK